MMQSSSPIRPQFSSNYLHAVITPEFFPSQEAVFEKILVASSEEILNVIDPFLLREEEAHAEWDFNPMLLLINKIFEIDNQEQKRSEILNSITNHEGFVRFCCWVIASSSITFNRIIYDLNDENREKIIVAVAANEKHHSYLNLINCFRNLTHLQVGESIHPSEYLEDILLNLPEEQLNACGELLVSNFNESDLGMCFSLINSKKIVIRFLSFFEEIYREKENFIPCVIDFIEGIVIKADQNAEKRSPRILTQIMGSMEEGSLGKTIFDHCDQLTPRALIYVFFVCANYCTC